MRKALAVALVAVLAGGCAYAPKRLHLYRTDIEEPYTRLGAIEVKLDPWAYYRPDQYLWQLLSLGLYVPKRDPEFVKMQIDSELKRKARKFGADAVIKVEYYPDPQKELFKTGDLFAKGEMILFQRDRFTY